MSRVLILIALLSVSVSAMAQSASPNTIKPANGLTWGNGTLYTAPTKPSNGQAVCNDSGVLGGCSAGGGGSGGISVLSYGAKCDGSHLDSAGFQAAINAACGFQITVGPQSITPPISIPSGSCVLDKPVILTCDTNSNANLDVLTMNGSGYLATTLSPTNLGPAILMVASNAISQLGSTSGIITTAPPFGPGSALLWSGTTNQQKLWYLDLTEDLTSLNTNTTTPSPYMNGATAMTIRGFFKPTASGVVQFITGSNGSADYNLNNVTTPVNGATTLAAGFQGVWVDTDNRLHGWVTTSGNGLQGVVSTATVTTNAWNEYDLEYDGAHIGIALNGTFGTLVAATGTIVQRSDEVTTLGAIVTEFPHSQSTFYWNGALYDPEIANVARHNPIASYTADTAPFTGDSHSLYLSTFAQQMDMPTTTQPVLFGADFFNGAAVTNVWASVRAGGIGCCGGIYNTGNYTISGGGVGIEDIGTIATIEHVQLNNQTVMGINTGPNATFNSIVNDIRGGNARMGMVVLEGGLTNANLIQTQACGILCDLIAGGSFTNSYVSAASDTLWGKVFTGPMSVSNVNDDNENGGSCSSYILENGNGQVVGSTTITASQIASCNTASHSPVEIENVGQGGMITFIGDNFNYAGTPSAIVHQVGTPPFGSSDIIFENDSFGGSPQVVPAIPYVDNNLAYLVLSPAGATTSLTSASTVNVTSDGTKSIQLEYLMLGNNVTTINMPTAASMPDGKIIYLAIQQPVGGFNYTIPACFTAGSGTQVYISNNVTGGTTGYCGGTGVLPGMPTASYSELDFALQYRASQPSGGTPTLRVQAATQ